MSNKFIRRLAEGGIFVALAQILGYIKLWKMPWGGSVTLIMLPIIVFSVHWGWRSGLLAGFALGALQFMFDGGFVLGWQSILGDYVLAYTLVGLAGLFRGKPSSVFVGACVGAAGRWLSVYITGATLWAEYMPGEFFGMTMTTPWFYSALYNGAYILASLALCLILLALPIKALKRYYLGQDISG